MQKSNCIRTLSFEEEHSRLTVKLGGEIDHHGAVSVRSEIDEAIAIHQPKTTVIELSAIDFMDSSGIGLIMGRYAKMKAIGGELILRRPSERTMKIFEMAGLMKIVSVETQESEENKEEEK